ncbi:DUF5329 domain-containing protein [Dokdonella sp.]|uniref:DUF5329 domain-containing protein n=1 Tax=Dokdonella sp. TaxID=2291710 RepID=UPI003C39A32D
MKRILLITTFFLHSAVALASPLPHAARAEIRALLDVLEQSDCEFYRNGSWYAGPKAASHLQRKLDYLERKDLLTGTDTFIALAASKSSMSGEVYQVRCPGKTAVPSADWFNAHLEQLRGESGD